MEIANAKNLRDDGEEGRVAEKGSEEIAGKGASTVAEGANTAAICST